ncbi:MAG: HPr family phosphocarrier protein [Candidatus Izemoplasmatales bacterium]
MATKTIVYKKEIAFHIRPISLFTHEVKKSGCKVVVSKGDLTVQGEKTMQLLQLEICKNDEITITVNGANEEILLDKLIQIMNGGE